MKVGESNRLYSFDNRTTLAYSHDNGEVRHDAWIGFGGDMEPELYNENEVTTLKDTWQKICKKKVDEAYHEFLIKTNLKDKSD